MSATNLNSPYDGLPETAEFFAIIRQWQRLLRHQAGAHEEPLAWVGEDGPIDKESIRFKTIKSLGFSLGKIETAKDEVQDLLTVSVNFMGLLGGAGVLPSHYSRLALERIKKNDNALADFIGLFEHRLIALYYRAWSKYQFPVQFEESNQAATDSFSKVLKSATGFHRGNLINLYYGGHFSKRNRSLINLQHILQEMLSTPVSVQAMVGRWQVISKRDRCRIGVYGQNHRLGNGLILGNRYWDKQSHIVIQVKELSMDDYLRLDESTEYYQLVTKLIHDYVPVHIQASLELHVMTRHQENAPLGKNCRLSRNCWLLSKPKDTLISRRLLKRSLQH